MVALRYKGIPSCILICSLIASAALFLLPLPSPNTMHPVATTLSPTRQQILDAYGKVPVRFEINRGQAPSEYQFLARGANYNLLLKPDGADLKSKHENLGLRFVGANPAMSMVGTEALPGESNYFIGSAEQWITHVPAYGRIRSENVYRDIDVDYYSNSGHAEYDIIVRPGASPGVLSIRFEGTEKVALEGGDIVLSIGGKQIRQKKALAYQDIDGAQRVIESRYVLRQDGTIGFALAAYDRRRPLIIDPELDYSIYLSGFDSGLSVAVDPNGDVYVCGNGLDQFSDDTNDAFVFKLNSAGTAVIYNNVFGGAYVANQANAVVADPAGNAYVTGSTAGSVRPSGGPPHFPTLNPIQPNQTSGAFLTKFDPVGNMLFSSILGGSAGDESGNGIALDSTGNVYIVGATGSTDFPTVHPLQANLAGGSDAFVMVINPQETGFVFSTYVGGTGDDSASAIAVDTNGNSYVTGVTQSSNFPLANALQAYGGGQDAFAFKLNAAGSAFAYATYLGGSSNDRGNAIAVDASGNAYIAGTTSSANFPTSNAIQLSLNGSSDAFAAKINPTGSALAYSTYLGGSGDEQGNGITVNANGNAYIVGTTTSPDFPTVRSLEVFEPSSDVFVTKLASTGVGVVYSTLLAGSSMPGAVGALNRGLGIVADSHGSVYITGVTSAANYPVTTNQVGGQVFPNSVTQIFGFLSRLLDDPNANILLTQSNAAEGSGVGSLTVPFQSANQAGDLIVAFVRMSTTSETVSVTDRLGNVYSDAVAQGQDVDGHQIHIFYASNIAGGANSVTATFSSLNNHPWLAIYEYSGLGRDVVLDRTAHAEGNSAMPSSGLTRTTTYPDELVFAGAGLPSSYTGSPTPGFAFTAQQQDTNTSRAFNETGIASSTGSYGANFGLSSPTNWTAAVATFKAGPLQIITTALPDAQVNRPYQAVLRATGGVLPYSWTFLPFTFPAGLTGDPSTGAISGTPGSSGCIGTVPCQYTFTVVVTDAIGHKVDQVFNLKVSGAIQLLQCTAVAGSGVSSVAAAFPSSTNGGNLIIAFVRMSTTSETVTVEDTAGNVFTDAVSEAQSVDGHQTHLFYAKGIRGGPDTVTATFSAANNHPWIAVYEFSGLNSSNPLDQTARAQGSGSVANSGNTPTTSGQFELIFGATGLPASYTGTVAASGNYTLLNQDTTTSRAATEFAIVSGTASFNSVFNLSPGTNWSALIATFKT